MATPTSKIDNITRTIYGNELMTNLVTGSDHEVRKFTSLNEKLTILPDIVPPAGSKNHYKFITIGAGGHTHITGAEGISVPVWFQHHHTDGALFRHLPFVLVPLTNDLSPAERARFCLRRIEEHRGEAYVAYYGLRKDFAANKTNLLIKQIINEEVKIDEFVPDSSVLNPVRSDIQPVNTNIVASKYGTVSKLIALIFTDADLDHLRNVAEVLFNDANYAIISEIGICSGVDRNVQVPGVGNQTFDFLEVTGAQLCAIADALIPAKSSSGGTAATLNLGTTEPLLKIRNEAKEP